MTRQEIIVKIRQLREELFGSSAEERKAILEQLCILMAQLATAK